RNCSVPPSLLLGRGMPAKFLYTEKSKLLMPCPRTMLRAASPNWPAGSAAKAAVLNHSCRVWMPEPELGLPMRLARYPPHPQWAISPDWGAVGDGRPEIN